MSERMDGWRYCDDPAELAAAVADGVEVQRNWGYDWQPGTNNETAEQFAGCTKANCRYRVPASWSWSPEPPTDVPTGAERYLAERLADPEYRACRCRRQGRGRGVSAVLHQVDDEFGRGGVALRNIRPHC